MQDFDVVQSDAIHYEVDEEYVYPAIHDLHVVGDPIVHVRHGGVQIGAHIIVYVFVR